MHLLCATHTLAPSGALSAQILTLGVGLLRVVAISSSVTLYRGASLIRYSHRWQLRLELFKQITDKTPEEKAEIKRLIDRQV